MRKLIQILCACSGVAFVSAAILSHPVRVHHQDSSAFPTALNAAVDRLENGGRAALGATAVMMNATAPAVVAQVGTATTDGRYTCDTYFPNFPTCQPGTPNCPYAGAPHTTDPNGHTCHAAYTCQMATCQTYDPQSVTCDPNRPDCNPANGHTTETPPFNHTCDGHTCDGTFTCDITADPRGFTCDAANTQCYRPTFNAFQITCNPLVPDCRRNNPGACTAQPMNPTCSGPNCPMYTSNPQSVTCDASCTPTSSPTQPTCDNGMTCAGQPTCAGTPTCYNTCTPATPTCDPASPTCNTGPTCDPMGTTCTPALPTCDPTGATCNGPTCAGFPTCQVTQPTCDPASPTCSPGQPTCDPSGPTCSTAPTCDPGTPTCSQHYTCGQVTCSTYQPSEFTCDRGNPACQYGPHTTEPPPYNHTCEGATCDGRFTCDFTLDPRSLTCDANNMSCMGPTFQAGQYTCNPHLPQCRNNNPRHCTSQIYETCQSGNPNCPPVGVEGTTWGKVKEKYRRR